MRWILSLAGTTLGGWIGWAIGARFGIMAGFLVSIVGSALALYWTNKFTRDLLG